MINKFMFLIISILYINLCIAQTVSLELVGIENYRQPVYLYMDNRLTIVIENESCDDIYAETDNGTIEKSKYADCKYILHPKKMHRASISIHKISGSDTIFLEERKLQVKPLPFTALLGRNHLKKHYPKEELLNSRLRVEALNTGLSARLKIKSFCLAIIRDCEVIHKIEFGKMSEEIWEKVLAYLSKTNVGDKVIFDGIKYDYFGYELEANSIEIEVK